MPRIEFSFLADAAEAEPGRKFYVLGGGVDTIGAGSFPVVHPHLSLVMRIVVHPMEADQGHTLDIKLIDSDGKEMTTLQGNFSAADSARSGKEIPMNLVLNFQNTRFERPGDYSIEIFINKEPAASLPLRLQHVQQA